MPSAATDDPDPDLPAEPDADVTGRIIFAEPDEILVQRRPRWRQASLLTGLTCEGKHTTQE